ncbi:hypothetical protein PMI01_04036 [Caulobacter sp. AP07]|uniref:hypothetical protein n=1 Tax=Caulobacter sp. AP07 TaxID=1144304 RepID=UPI0002722599|nr:hypothetical protein [Caulobacter sp. AP07]EJL26745.1 hypothetical protein PMI01_04036 [Caulobacter sp. AP07]
MTQTTIPAWCETLQAKLMAAIDAAWATIESSDDPVAIRQARDKAKACGELAAVARKVAALVGLGRPKPAPAAAPTGSAAVLTQAEHALRALEQLKARRRR